VLNISTINNLIIKFIYHVHKYQAKLLSIDAIQPTYINATGTNTSMASLSTKSNSKLISLLAFPVVGYLIHFRIGKELNGGKGIGGITCGGLRFANPPYGLILGSIPFDDAL